MLPTLVSYRIQILTNLKNLFQSQNDDWNEIKLRAFQANNWFTIDNIDNALQQIASEMLDAEKLENWLQQYPLILQQPDNKNKTAGLIMAGNIPLVGFNDFLCLFIAGFSMKLKLSSKDTILWKYIIQKIQEWDTEKICNIEIADMLKNCDLYIATGSNNSSRYFESYFSKYPHIIRKNRTSVAILSGNESPEELIELKNDISSYFGLGCRNVTQLFVPEDYDFTALIELFDADENLTQHTKYKNNYDYYLAIYLLNKVKHWPGNNVLIIDSDAPFAPIASIHYQPYKIENQGALIEQLENDVNIQAIVGNFDNNASNKCVPFGNSQCPTLMNYADGVDTMAFLSNLTQ